MTHLGDTASAFVDGALDDETAWRVSAHVAKCRSCRAEIDAERALKNQLGAAPAQAPMPSGLAAALLGIAAQPMTVGHGCAPAAAGAPSRRPAARVAQAAPRGRADVGGPGRSVRTGGYRRAGGRYVAAAGLAATVMVGLGGAALGGGGALGSGAGTLAGGPAGATASTSAANAANASLTQAELTRVSSSLSSLLPVAGRSIGRPSTRAALSVVYRQP